MKNALNIKVTGIVQGVGFRPFVYKQAKLNLITGWVQNSISGVDIFAEGEDANLDSFCMSLANDAPASAKVEQIEMEEVPIKDYDSFEIKTSSSECTDDDFTLVSPDIGICYDCLTELFDKNNKRYHYPFINCTNCGPRFTIIDRLPYDRKNTSMKTFTMCRDCSAEYSDVENRRFHAQPNACFECGPHISWVETSDGKVDESKIIWGDSVEASDSIIDKCVKMLLDGQIVAVKGLGGYHLVCDAMNENSVSNLRARKQRNDKAFAIMTSEFDAIEKIVFVNDIEKKLLNSYIKPIVLLKNKKEHNLAPSVCMGLSETGIMLPYTPVQALLLDKFIKLGGQYLVMTSGNICDEAICIDDNHAYDRLASIADAFLGNDRKIINRYDDSVVRVLNTAGTNPITMIRRARGYAPAPLKLKTSSKINNIFAVGPEQKNTFCFMRPLKNPTDKYNTEAFVSQYIGDMENESINKAWFEAKTSFENTFNLFDENLAIDTHPEYLTSKWAKSNCKDKDKIFEVQHHFAHIASVIAENDIQDPVAGFAFDGTGYGADGNIWGGEVLICNNKDYERFANLSYIPIPGSANAIKNPLKMAYGLLWSLDLLDHEGANSVLSSLSDEEVSTLQTMIDNNINCPQTSSIGRLFDAVSAILGVCIEAKYEGQPAIMLEAIMHKYLMDKNCDSDLEYDSRYDIKIIKNVGTASSTAHDTSVVLLDPVDTIKAILEDMCDGKAPGLIAKHFHDSIVRCIVNVSTLIHQLYGIKTIALAGGVFMNRYLVEKTIDELAKSGFSVAINRELPPNDGSISCGEAFVCSNNY